MTKYRFTRNTKSSKINAYLRRNLISDYSKYNYQQRVLLQKLQTQAVEHVSNLVKHRKYGIDSSKMIDLPAKAAYDTFIQYLPKYFVRKSDRVDGKPYTTGFQTMKTDPFVRKCLKATPYSHYYYDSVNVMSKSTNNIAALKSLSAYGSNKARRPRSCLYDKAIEITRKRFFGNGDIPFAKLSEMPAQFDPSSSAGNTFRGRKKGEALDDIYDVAMFTKHMIKRNAYRFPKPLTTIAYRGHLSEDTLQDHKTRVIFNTPSEIQSLEAVFCYWLYQYQLEHHSPMFFGEGTIGRLRDIFTTPKSNETIFTADVSQFDASITPWMIHDAMFRVIWPSLGNHKMKVDGSTSPMKDSSKRKMFTMWKWIYKYNVYTPILLPNGKIVQKTGGLLSGSYMTQMLGSIINFMLGTYIDLLAGMEPTYYVVLGDDSRRKYSVSRSDFPIDFYSEQYKIIGLTVHPKKCVIVSKDNYSEDKFLGYQFRYGRLYRPSEKFFQLALYPEHPVETIAKSAARLIAFLMLGGCYDADFSDFCYQFFNGYEIKNIGSVDRALKIQLKYSLSAKVLENVSFNRLKWLDLEYTYLKTVYSNTPLYSLHELF